MTSFAGVQRGNTQKNVGVFIRRSIDALFMDWSVGISVVLGPNDSSHVASTCLEDVEDVVER